MSEKVTKIGLYLLPTIICSSVFAGALLLCMQKYSQIGYENISSYTQTVIENNPEMEQDVLTSLKEYSGYSKQKLKNNTFLAQYGYQHSDFESDISWRISLYMLTALVLSNMLYFIVGIYTDKKSKKRIQELTDYLEQINTKDGGSILPKKEDAFSMLQDEIYKTVTNLFQTKEAALQAKRNFADNLANIAHQIKTPITASFLSLQLMKKSNPNSYAEQIEKQLKHLNWMEETLLLISKIDTGTLCLEKQKVDIYTVLNLAAENLSDLLEEENIVVSISDNGCATMWGDLEWTMEAFINLLKNCMEHSSKGGCIYCNYTLNPLYIEIHIWDEGGGFTRQDKRHLFERFYRGENAAANGVGIGLPLAREIIEMQNGTIRAYNLTEKGACFEIRFYSH